MTSGESSPASQVRPLDVFLSVVALYALAVAQPLLDLLGRNAEFFLARAAPPLDIVLLALVLGIGIPAALGFVVAGVYRLNPAVGRALHSAVLAILAAIFVLQLTMRTPLGGLPGWLEIVLALGAGSLVVIGFYRYDTLRSLFRFAAVAPLVVVGLFLFTSTSSQLVFTAPALAEPAAIPVGNPAPVVMVIFDEFPAASLMDADGEIQAEVYPNFARLAEDGTWFSNATTVEQQTENSVPAILTGKDPGDRGRLPTAADYPASLFSMLADTYDLYVREAVTEICPEYACENTLRPTLPVADRWRSLSSDLQVVAGHVFLPEDIADELPPINQTWSNFASVEGIEDWDIIARFQELEAADRRLPVQEFIEAIGPEGEKPSLYFLHALLPHVPWSYLRSGQEYPAPSPAPGSESPGWGSDEWLVNQGYQQHLIQVLYVDTIVGDLIDRLEEVGMYDDALIVILADHGVTVRPDIPHRRVAYDSTIGDVAAIPLFIKRPNDPGAPTETYRALTVDLVPTIADVLGIDLPWEVEGTSLFADERPERNESQITGDEGVITFGTDGAEVKAVAARKVTFFGDRGPYGLAPEGQADLLGVSAATLEVDEVDPASVTLRDEDTFATVDLDGPFLPARVRGVLHGEHDDDVVIAVALNGEIAAVTRSYETENDTTEFSAFLPPSSLVEGANDVELLIVEGSGAERTFRAVSR